MTTVYQDSTIDSFDLKSFFFGCTAATKVSAVQLPVNCTTTVQCINSQGQSSTPETFAFVTNGGLVQDMVQAQVSRQCHAV